VAGTWTSAVGYWVIPAVAKPAEPQGTEGGWNSSSWVGIDGTFGSDDVLQAGIEQKVDANGNPSYVAWYEWYAPPQPNSPAYVWQTNIPNFSVSPGQTVYCSVQYVSNKTAGYVVFGNEATGQHFAITLAPPPNATFSGNTAEWIMEAPDGGIPTASLPAFTPVTFTSAVCCGPNNTSGNPAAADGNVFNIVGFGTALTSVTTGQSTVTIDYAGPEYWIDNDLTGFTGGVPAAPGSALDGYWGTDNSQHVNYISTDGHIHELYIHP
jgi:Peptidase A4 family